MAFRGGPLGGNETLGKLVLLPLGLPGGLPRKFCKGKSISITQVTLFYLDIPFFGEF